MAPTSNRSSVADLVPSPVTDLVHNEPQPSNDSSSDSDMSIEDNEVATINGFNNDLDLINNGLDAIDNVLEREAPRVQHGDVSSRMRRFGPYVRTYILDRTHSLQRDGSFVRHHPRPETVQFGTGFRGQLANRSFFRRQHFHETPQRRLLFEPTPMATEMSDPLARHGVRPLRPSRRTRPRIIRRPAHPYTGDEVKFIHGPSAADVANARRRDDINEARLVEQMRRSMI